MIVSHLPPNNLLLNPWFHDANNQETFDGWTPDTYWSLSVPGKKNPSPDSQNGTAAKLGPPDHNGGGVSGVPGTLYQIVTADPNALNLTFQTWVIGVRQDFCTINVYGSNDNGETWQLAWTPLHLTTSTGGYVLHGAQTQLEQGFPLYKVEAVAQYTDGNQSLGSKFTGFYFTAL